MMFRLRVAMEEDVPEIQDVIAASVTTLQAADYTEAQRERALQTVFTVDTRLIADGTYLVALAADGPIVGCGGWSRRRTLYGGDAQVEQGNAALLDAAVDAAKIRAIFVHPAYARCGLGAALLRAAENAAQAAGFRCMEMGSTLTGVEFYRRRGYRAMERREVPVGGGETIGIVRMTKDAPARSSAVVTV